ncbi:MAG TPA: PspC domain-containing protein [Chitinophagaceae bacterium]|nr:PspC domain-containing protein [Chitinophagaceae bacterium]
MKKIININFQGRVIPIEESAYDTLKQYVDSLRRYFATEDGRDEIINDIESRIAELFSERLKRGSACITDDDINAVITSMGRPQDFEEQAGAAEAASAYQAGSQQQAPPPNYANVGRGRLYRNADDKIIGGVCSGLANYMGIDPVILRVIFVILFGALFWIYILLWIIVPSQSLQTNITKRLYRNADDRVIAGVCGGLSSYFNIDSWIPRLVFALPLIIGLISGTMNAIWWNWDFGFAPRVITGSLGSTLFITYIILWIAVPFASTASEKLEMRGERVDLNSIRDTVKEDLENFKTRTEKWGQEVKQTAQDFGNRASSFGQTAGTHAKQFASEAAPLARRAGSGLGHVIGLLFKVFFMFVAGIIAITLLGVLIALLFGGMAAFPLKNFILEGPGQNLLAWATLLLFLGVPLVGLITWLVRRIMGVRSKNHYLGYTFGGLWVVGIFCFVFLIGSFARNFKVRMPLEDKIAVNTPANDKLYVDVTPAHLEYYHGDWFGFRFSDEMPVYGVNMDTLMLNTVRIKLAKSKDSSYHVTRVRLSQGNTRDIAVRNAERIQFAIEQRDSVLYLPEGFPVSASDKFRGQQVLIIIQVPVGKRIELSDALTHYDWFSINVNNRRGWNVNFDDYSDESYNWDANTEYIMTPEGNRKVSELDPEELKNGRFKIIIDEKNEKIKSENDFENKGDKNHYRYKQLEDSIKEKAKEQLREELKIQDSIKREKRLKEIIKTSSASDNAPASSNGGDDEPGTAGSEGHIMSPLMMLSGMIK